MKNTKNVMFLLKLTLLFFFIITRVTTVAAEYSIGVNYGTVANNLPPPTQVADFLKTKTQIDKIKIFDSNPEIIKAFANSGISLTITIGNGDIPSVSNLAGAKTWVSNNILPFHPQTAIRYLAVGNEVLATHDKVLIANLLKAMKSLHQALRDAGINGTSVTTPHSLGILSSSEPPSSGRFRKGYDRAIFAPMLEYHKQTQSPFMVNPYPYFGFTAKTLNYALFKPNDGVFDNNTGLKYTNMFDAQLDAVYSAMKEVGYGDVDIVVGETGWSSMGDPNQPDLNLENAISFNGNLVKHLNTGNGTPLMPNRTFETYVFSLFNENLKESTAERNFGLFRPDLTPVYDVGVLRDGQAVAPTSPISPAPSDDPSKNWCVPKPDASDEALQSNIDYVCSAGIDCSPIQDGGSCFDPNTRRSHASYVMNAYFQAHGRTGSACAFAQTGMVISSDPSYEACKYVS